MKRRIDACGLTCPAPVLLVKDAVEHTNAQQLTVLVDNESSRENVSRFLGSKGYSVIDSFDGGIYRLEAQSDQESSALASQNEEKQTPDAAGQKILVLVTSDTLGYGDDMLGVKLMINYLNTIKEMGTDLWQLIFLNSGVKLTTQSSPVLDQLREYEKSGVVILSCGTCLEHFGLTALKKVGGTTNMLDIVTATQLADKVITLN